MIKLLTLMTVVELDVIRTASMKPLEIRGFCLRHCFLFQFQANIDQQRLYDDLLTGYNRLIRPVAKNTDKLTVYFGLKLTQILDVVRKPFPIGLIGCF